jgi:hypothetical protein
VGSGAEEGTEENTKGTESNKEEENVVAVVNIVVASHRMVMKWKWKKERRKKCGARKQKGG